MLVGFINRQDKSKMALRTCLTPLYSLVLSKIQTPDNLNRYTHDIPCALGKQTLHLPKVPDGPNCCLQLHTRSAPPPCHSCSLQQSHGNLPPSLKPTGHTTCMWPKTLMASTCCHPTDDTPPSTAGHTGALLVLMLCCTFQLAHHSHWLL